jgi:ATP-dependent helicase/nuclease subunit B
LLAIATETRGALEIQRPTRRFTLTARADRIERATDGRLAILDYKTGSAPSRKAVMEGLAPQLTLEAAMAEAGGFGPDLKAATAELTYWELKGGYESGKAIELFKGSQDALLAAVNDALRGLEKLIDDYDQPDRCYFAQPNPLWTPRFSDHAQLARVAEWSLAEEDEP